MKFVTVRDLRLQSSEVWQQLQEEQELVLTSNGRPIALIVNVADGEVEETMAAVRRARAQIAVSRLRKKAQGVVPSLSAEEIDTEIQATRQIRHPK